MKRKKMKQGCVKAIGDFDAMVEAANDRRLKLRFAKVHCNRWTITLHFMLDCRNTGKRVLNWWPGNGKVYSPVTGESSKIKEWPAVLTLAAKIAEEELARKAAAEREEGETASEMNRHLDSIARE